jgi:hypothetical protein
VKGGQIAFGRDSVQNTKFILCDLLTGGSQRTGGIKTKYLFLSNATVAFIYSIGPLWSSGQSVWLQIQRSRVRSPALPDFLSSSGSGTGSTQPREVN